MITPSFPTLSIASARIEPIVRSPRFVAAALMAPRGRILVLDSTVSAPELLDILGEEVAEARAVGDLLQAREAWGGSRFDVLIADLESCDSLPSEAIRDLRRRHPEIPLVLIVRTG